MSDDHTFSANKIFGYLFLYTALEVAWGTLFDFPRWAIWSGLLIFAFLKGYLIFTWFMHMKFEQPILKFMVVPTIPLVAILIFANMPDTSFNDDMLYPIGHQLDVELKYVDEYQDKDKDGNLLFDAHGDPVMKGVERPAMDEEGNPILDAQGEAVMLAPEVRLMSKGVVSGMPDVTVPKAVTKDKAHDPTAGGH